MEVLPTPGAALPDASLPDASLNAAPTPPRAPAKAVAVKPPGQSTASTQDEARYRSKFRQLKTKLTEIEEENVKLQLKILHSKRNIQRLRLERSMLYERLGANQGSADLSQESVEAPEQVHESTLAPSTSNGPHDTMKPPLPATATPPTAPRPPPAEAVQRPIPPAAQEPLPVAAQPAVPPNGMASVAPPAAPTRVPQAAPPPAPSAAPPGA